MSAAKPQETLVALDLWPLAQKLSRDDQLRLAKLLLRGARGRRTEAEAYETAPSAEQDLSSEETALTWEGEGWEGFHGR